ncbi:MAG: putative anti-sigma factor antagonist [Ilumatobacteraceae bacterium]|nr:putative anti-sigma factor antagonist [Ilumatobacteraceae bacterium]
MLGAITVVPSDSMSDTAARLDISTGADGLVLAGELDAHTAPQLAERLVELPPGDGVVVLDVERVEFMDSSGLRVVIDVHQRAVEANRRLVLRHPTAAVQRLLEISGLSDHIATE